MSDDKNHKVELKIKSLKSGSEVHLHVSEALTLDQLWNTAVGGEHLNEPRNPDDVLRCAGGEVMTPHLSKTLEQLKNEHICHPLRLEIRGPSGGACA